MWTTFVIILTSSVAGDVIWHFLQLWMIQQAWYQKLVAIISFDFTKELMEEMNEEED